jgi:hypothetical protein
LWLRILSWIFLLLSKLTAGKPVLGTNTRLCVAFSFAIFELWHVTDALN